MRGTRKGIATVALAVGLTLGSSGIADAVTVGVRGISPNVWSPKVRRIAPGSFVRWFAVNANHNVTSRGANWSYVRSLRRGTSVARRFNRRGTFRFRCTIHSHLVPGACHGMCGSIVVS